MSKRFYINEEKRIVVCVLSDSYGKVIGKAKCHKDDVFDINIGKRISLGKAKLKRQNRKIKYLNKEINDVKKTLDSLNKQLEKSIKIQTDMIKNNKLFE